MILKPFSRVIANYKIKKSKNSFDNVSAFSGISFEDIRSVLIISPNQSIDSKEAEESISVVKSQFTKVEVSYFNSSEIPEKSKNLYAYPKVGYLKPLMDKEYNLIIDLSKKYSLLNTYVITMMLPTIRIKLYNDLRNDAYYSFIFSSQKKTYANLTRHCLAMLHHVLSKKIIK